MQIECPSCHQNNEIEYAKNIKCGSCQKTLAGHFYKRASKPFLSTAIVVGITAFGGYSLLSEDNSDRYPIAVEYELINSCSNLSYGALSRKSAATKQNMCICALKETMSEISYHKIDNSNFSNSFSNNLQNCN
jgi:20S proteasome alpha/beta subunit